MNNKKAMTYWELITLFIAIGTLIIFLFLISQPFTVTEKSTRILECSQIFESSSYKSTFMGTGYDQPSELFLKFVEGKCIQEKVKYEDENDLHKVRNLLNNCWEQGGSGTNFLSNMNGNVCLLCGTIEVDNNANLKKDYFDDIDKFDKSTLENEILGLNINNVSLFEEDNFPNANNLLIYYYIEQKIEQPSNAAFQLAQDAANAVKNQINQYTIGQILMNAVSNDASPDYVAGIVMGEVDTQQDKYEIKRDGKSLTCDYVYIPRNIYEE